MREGDFSTSTKELLAKRVGYRCSNPDCRQPTSGPQLGADAKTVNVGQAAHIVAASKKGPRGDSPLVLDERGALDNGIWLCNKCHKLVDDDRDYYTVDMLRNWKNTAEQRAHDEIARLQSPPTSTALVLPLPADLPDFTGRQAQIDRVRDQLNQQGAVTITGVYGMGGIGKTALAVHIAHQLVKEGRFRDAQLYIDLKGVDPTPVDPVDALDGLLNSIQEPDQEPDQGPDPDRPRDLKALEGLWHEAIKGRDALLILDNAADANQVRSLLPGCPTCAVLVTSRRRFTLPGARRLDLRPMRRAEARNLLQELAPHLDDDGADQIAGLCGRLPQALRIAGNYLNLNDDVTPDQYAAMLADERTRLAQLRDSDHPDLDVHATISLSVNQLDQDTRRAWALLSLFPVSFDLPAAAALWDEPEDQVRIRLQTLRNRSLVTYDPGSARYHQHDLVRLAAAGELQALAEGESYAAHLRLARHFKQVADAADDLFTYGGAKAFQGLALFDLELPHIRAAQAWAAAHADHHDEAARLCIDYGYAAARILAFRLHTRDRIAWREPALRAARRLGRRQAESWHLSHLGLAYADLGETHQAIDHYQQALVISKEIGDRRTEAAQLANLGSACSDLGETHRAIDYYQQALEIAKKIGNRRGEGAYLHNLGLAYANLGETHKAIDYYQQALVILKEIGDRLGEGHDLGGLAIAYQRLGEISQAIQFYEEAIAIAEEIGDRTNESIHSWNLGIMLEDSDPARAVELMEVRIRYLQDISHPDAEADAQRVEEIRKRL